MKKSYKISDSEIRTRPVTFTFPEYGIYILTSRHGHGFQMPLHCPDYHEVGYQRFSQSPKS